jgi:hypothetical protein
MERRALRRAADQALLTSLSNPTSDQAGGAPDQDFKYRDSAEEIPQPVEPPAPAYDDHDPDTAPIPVIEVGEPLLPHSVPPWERVAAVDIAAERSDVYDLVPDQPVDVEPADDWWDERDDHQVEQEPPAPVRPLRARPLAETAYVRPELDFVTANYREPRWYRAKPAAAVLAAVVIAALMGGGWLIFRSPGTAAEQSSPEAPPSAPPAPSTAAPTAVSAPLPKPAPPPPPPPPPPAPPAPEPTYSAPQRQYQPRYSEPSPTQKPRVDVTRAPMSVAPVPKPVPGSDSSTPGDAPGEKPRRRGCFGFC